MEPQIRYCTTSDGVCIAYWSIGEGAPVVEMGPPPGSHIRMEWSIPELRDWYERFAAHHLFVRYDGRGSGLSDRDIDEYSVRGMALDLAAVVDDLRLEQFALCGSVNSGLAAVAYAAEHPDRVSRLILWCAYAQGREFFDDPGTRALRDMIERDWHMAAHTASQSRFSWSAPDFARRFGELYHEAVTPRVQAMLMDALRDADVMHLLPRVRCPTLILQREDRGPAVARRMAAAIPDARVVLFKGGSAAQYLDDAEEVWRHIASFLGDPLGDASAATNATTVHLLRTVLFTDIVGHTEMMRRLGDTKGRDVLREHERITRETLRQHGGAEVKTMGDGFMASFGSVTSAVECAISLQRAFGGALTSGPSSAVAGDGGVKLDIRIGLNAGEPIAEEGDLFGSTVILAARIAAQAGAGEILIPEAVRHLLAGKDFTFADRGEFAMKGFDDAVRLYEVRWREED